MRPGALRQLFISGRLLDRMKIQKTQNNQGDKTFPDSFFIISSF